MATITVLYPQGTKFDMDYYKAKHMPLVHNSWKKYGLTSWKVLTFPSDAPYSVQATLEFDSFANFEKASTSPEAQEVFGDVKNFSDNGPTLLAGNIVATS